MYVWYYPEMCLRFVLIQYDRNNCLEGGRLYSQIPKHRRQGTPCRAPWGRTSQEAERERAEHGPEPLLGFFWEEIAEAG